MLRTLAVLLGLWLTGAAAAHADVRVLTGSTPIVDGEAKAPTDLTVVNERLAFALAVGTAVPYGVPRGALIDIAPVVDGRIGRDCVVFADFIPNNWSAWPNTYQHVDVLERGPTRAVIETVRDWGKVTITTRYTLESGSDRVAIQTTMSNGGDALRDLLSGLTLWPKRGYFFGVSGLNGVAKGKTDGALTDRVFAYDEDWSVSLHAPYADHIADGGMDMYRLNSLAAGESRVYQGWLQVGPSGDLKPVVAAEIERRSLSAGNVHGRVVTSEGKAVQRPVVVVEKSGQPYAWVLGHDGVYDIRLPVGDYQLYATAKNHSQSPRTALTLSRDEIVTLNFGDLQPPGKILFRVAEAHSKLPLDARISILEGQKPVVEFLGRKTFFTELNPQGRADVPIAPGHYVFEVSSGGDFLAPRARLPIEVEPGRSRDEPVAVERRFDPRVRHWYSADLHHHADQAEAVTPPADLARSQLSAGLDLLFVSDHDSTVNHRVLQDIADRRGAAFVAGIELSASWGHFNAYPLMQGQALAIDTGTATVQQVFAEARRQGAQVIQVNHPFIPYGYFSSVKAGVDPGGFDPQFDLIEINYEEARDDPSVLHALWTFWNEGHRYYLGAGTDTHDVWRAESGAVRAYAHIDGAATASAYAEALRLGHGYVTYGPLVFPSVIFGDTVKLARGQVFAWQLELAAVDGLKSIELIGGGKPLKRQDFGAATQQSRVEFQLTGEASWYSLIIEDNQGHKAYTDPIWVDVVEPPPFLRQNP